MKRTISIWIGLLGLLALAALPVAFAQTPAQTTAPANVGPTGKIHGHVINPTGAAQSGGTMSLNNGTKEIATFDVDANGDYSGSAPPATTPDLIAPPAWGRIRKPTSSRTSRSLIVAGHRRR